MVAASQTPFWIGFGLAVLSIGVSVALLVLWAAGFEVIASEPIGPEQTDSLAVVQHALRVEKEIADDLDQSGSAIDRLVVRQREEFIHVELLPIVVRARGLFNHFALES